MAATPAATQASPAQSGQRFLLVFSLVLIVLAAILVWTHRGPVILAALVGFLLHPVYKRLLRFVKSRHLAASILLLLVAVALVLPTVLLGFALYEEAVDLAGSVDEPGALDSTMVGFLERVGLDRAQAEAFREQAAAQTMSALESELLPMVTAALTFFFGLIIFFFLLFFVLLDGEDLVAYARRVIPLDPVRKEQLFTSSASRVKAIFVGIFLVSVIQGVAAGLGWWFFGYPAPILWGSVMTVLAVLPFVGPFLVLIPAGLLRLLEGDLFAGIGLIIYALVLVGLIDDVIRPYVIGRRSSVHPAIILIGIIGGLQVFGVTGLILGPLLLSLLGPVMEAWARPEGESLAPPSQRAEHEEEEEEEEEEDDDEPDEEMREASDEAQGRDAATRSEK